jgi:hypothetical protein
MFTKNIKEKSKQGRPHPQTLKTSIFKDILNLMLKLSGFLK